MELREYFTTYIESTDRSLQLKDFLTPSVAFEITDSEFMYVGFYKRFCQFYLEFETVEAGSVQASFEYWNGTAWTDINAVDETENFSKSGFVYFKRADDWEKNAVNTEELYWVRVGTDTSLTVGTKLQGLNILFSNDLDLTGIRSNIVSKHNNGNSWIDKHEEARKWIIQKLRNAGHRTYKETINALSVEEKNVVRFQDLTAFDLLEPFELREAAKYYAIGMIYLNELSDEEDDKWERMGTRYMSDAAESLGVYMLKVDSDDDGLEDGHESSGLTRTDLTWA